MGCALAGVTVLMTILITNASTRLAFLTVLAFKCNDLIITFQNGICLIAVKIIRRGNRDMGDGSVFCIWETDSTAFRRCRKEFLEIHLETRN